MNNACILCLESSKPLTKEHIFPEAIGGTISKYLLCKPCNDKLGLWVDAPYVNQKINQLARVTHQIPGKTGKIPQPFSDIYCIEDLDSTLKIKLDSNFNPRILPEKPKACITENGEIEFSFSCDAMDSENIPGIIRATLTRLFKSEAGIQLGWSKNEQEDVIKKSILNAMAVPPISQKIQSHLKGTWTVDLKALYVEYVKVIYEICCLELGNVFRDGVTGQKLRMFLLAQCSASPAPWGYADMINHLNVFPNIPANLDGLIEHLTSNSPHTSHVVIVTPAFVICSMLGMGAVFRTNHLDQKDNNLDVMKVYLSSISGGKSGIFNLTELLVNT